MYRDVRSTPNGNKQFIQIWNVNGNIWSETLKWIDDNIYEFNQSGDNDRLGDYEYDEQARRHYCFR